VHRAVLASVTIEPWRRGTLAYQAPAVLERCMLSPAADCYAFGVLLWEMLTAQARPECPGVVHGCPGVLLAPGTDNQGMHNLEPRAPEGAGPHCDAEMRQVAAW
jgi:serine/threonine protein kinase